MAKGKPIVFDTEQPGSAQPDNVGGNEVDGGVGSDNNASNFVDPETAAGGTEGSDQPRRRGRPKGTKVGGSKKEEKASLDAFASLLYITHASLAGAIQCPELVLSEEESTRLAIAASNVSRHYNVGITDKQKDVIGLAIAAGAIYGGRIIAIKNRKEEEKRAKQRSQL